LSRRIEKKVPRFLKLYMKGKLNVGLTKLNVFAPNLLCFFSVSLVFAQWNSLISHKVLCAFFLSDKSTGYELAKLKRAFNSLCVLYTGKALNSSIRILRLLCVKEVTI
jgi:hypothetical protein